MGKRCKQYVAARLAKDPRKAFSQSTDNAERFLASQEFVNSAVKNLIRSLYANPKVEQDRIHLILANQDTVEELKRSLTKTNECCNFPAFLQSCGVKSPDLHMEKMIKASISSISKYLKEYTKTKQSVNASRIGSYFQKWRIPVDVKHLLGEVDTKNNYQHVSRRATLLPPIRPPVTRPADIKSKVPVHRGPIPMLRDLDDDIPQLREVPAFDLKEEEDDLPELRVIEEEEKSDIPKLVSLKVPSQPSIPIATKKSELRYNMALDILDKTLTGPYLKSILDRSKERFVFVCPVNDVLEGLDKELKSFNTNIFAAAELVVNAHLLFESGKGMYTNLDGVRFTLVAGGNSLQAVESKALYPILSRTKRQQYPRLDGTIRYFVTNKIIPKPKK